MAKVIGAEGQRGLEYALRRKESEDADRDRSTMRSRMALANSLSSLASDPDVGDPSLAYLGAATAADPTGIMGGILCIWCVAQVKAQNQKKRDALKSKKEADAGLALEQYGNLYGEERWRG